MTNYTKLFIIIFILVSCFYNIYSNRTNNYNLLAIIILLGGYLFSREDKKKIIINSPESENLLNKSISTPSHVEEHKVKNIEKYNYDLSEVKEIADDYDNHDRSYGGFSIRKELRDEHKSYNYDVVGYSPIDESVNSK